MRYVALLRGINVGGKNKVPMGELRTVFESVGMSDVRTYLNTGNVVFTAPASPDGGVFEEAIEERFGFPVRVLVLDGETLGSIARAIPGGWVNDSTMKCDVLFLWDGIDDASILDRLPVREGIDDVRYVPGAVIRRVDRENTGRSGMIRLVGTELYRSMTIRNCNTVRKLAGLTGS